MSSPVRWQNKNVLTSKASWLPISEDMRTATSSPLLRSIAFMSTIGDTAGYTPTLWLTDLDRGTNAVPLLFKLRAVLPVLPPVLLLLLLLLLESLVLDRRLVCAAAAKMASVAAVCAACLLYELIIRFTRLLYCRDSGVFVLELRLTWRWSENLKV